MNYIYIISLILIEAGILLILFTFIVSITKSKRNLKSRKCKNYAILIPARDESKVIKSLLDSLKKQVDNMNAVYIIVEKENDPTVKIANQYQANIIVRKNGKMGRKGYAIDEAIKEILKSKQHYDMYFIFDADNIVGDNFIEEMIKTYNEGYDIAIGYRNIKNPTNTIATCSGITFSFINTFVNKYKNKKNKNIIISGTGYYISRNLIDKWQGFPFHSLTEDYQLTLYSSVRNINSYYNESAIFYDEQPETLNMSIKQRTRWIKGFLEARKIEFQAKNDFSIVELLGITPYLMLIIGLIVYVINSLGLFIGSIITSTINFKYLLSAIAPIIIVYIILAFITLVCLLVEKDKINIPKEYRIKTILFNPIFLITYVICLVKAITTRNLKWDKIDHHSKKISK